MRFKSFVKVTVLSLVVSQMLYAEDSSQNLDSVTVTANKVEENIQDVPQSITVIDAEIIDEKGIQDINDMNKEIPNVNSSLTGYFNDVNIRGLNSSTFTNNNPIVIYVDGVPTSNRVGYDIPFSNIERIEVLRGPQGTLYGKDSIGGVINVITKTPTNDWSGHLVTEYGSNNSQYAKFDTNGALIKDKLFLGVTGTYAHDDGWIENTSNGEDANENNQHSLGLNLTYKASDKLKIKANVSDEYRKIEGYGDSIMLPSTDSVNNAKRDNYEKISFNNETYTKFDTATQSLAINYISDEYVFDSITTHKYMKSDGDYDMDYGNGNSLYEDLIQFQHSTTENTTQEFRFSGVTQNDIKWLSGLYYEREVYKNDRYGSQYPGSLYGYSYDLDVDDISKTESDTKAIFAQSMIPIDDKLELTLGGRYQILNRDFVSNVYYNAVGSTGASANPSLDAEHTWKVFLPKTSLSYKVDDTLTTYATISKGYIPGGYNFWTSSSIEAENRFKPQTSINYELGTRMSLDNLYLSAALFYMDIKDVHVYIFDSTSGQMVTSNVDKATSKGVELELNYLINDEWKFNGAFGYTNAKYKSSYVTTSGENNGNTIEKTPAYTLNVGLQYMGGSGIYGKFDIYSKGKTYLNPENTWKQEKYATADIKLGYMFDDYDLYTYMKNISDEDYIVGAMEASAGNMVSFGEGRRFGVGMRYSF